MNKFGAKKRWRGIIAAGLFSMTLVIFTGVQWVHAQQDAWGPDQFEQYGLTSASNPVWDPLQKTAAFWTFHADKPLEMVSAANGRVFTASIGSAWPDDRQGTLYALSASTGELLWQKTFANWIKTAPVVKNHKIFIGTGNQYFSKQNNLRVNALAARHVVRGRGSAAIIALNE
ncbi:MAG: PQQ-binding-like beta-propeller repeat protein, partial [Firmicutes bacterium]|nr:PQQ-binding-like beta-propeller repeat protein [Bacillota bacterium]